MGNLLYLWHALICKANKESTENTFAFCRTYGQGRAFFFENGTDVPAFVHTEQLSVSKLPIAAQYAQIRDKSLFFQKKCPNACICAKFVVTLHVF